MPTSAVVTLEHVFAPANLGETARVVVQWNEAHPGGLSKLASFSIAGPTFLGLTVWRVKLARDCFKQISNEAVSRAVFAALQDSSEVLGVLSGKLQRHSFTVAIP